LRDVPLTEGLGPTPAEQVDDQNATPPPPKATGFLPLRNDAGVRRLQAFGISSWADPAMELLPSAGPSATTLPQAETLTQ
jgi:hypothetical protein